MPLLTCNSVFITLDLQHFSILTYTSWFVILAFTVQVSLLTCHTKCVPIGSLHVTHGMAMLTCHSYHDHTGPYRPVGDCSETYDTFQKTMEDHRGP